MRAFLRWVSIAAVGLGCGLAADARADAAEEGTLLKHDDGSMESKLSLSGGGHAVLFRRPEQGEWFLDQVQLFGSRYGTDQPPNDDFTIYVTDEAMQQACAISKPHAIFKKGAEKWVAIPTPPVKVPESFYVCVVFNPTRTKGVYVGVDENVNQSHSKNAVPDSHIEPMKKTADWMIRAHLTQKPQGTVLQLLDKSQRESQQTAKAAERDSRLLKDAKAVVLKYDDGKMDQHQSFSGAGAQAVLFEAPQGEHYVYGISFYGSQYGGQHEAEAVSGDVYLLDAQMRVISRTSFPYSLLTYQSGWIDVPVLLTKVKGKFYVAIHAHSEQYKGLYVGYSERVARSHSGVGLVAPQQFTWQNAPKKLEWMIRVKLADRPVYYEAAPGR